MVMNASISPPLRAFRRACSQFTCPASSRMIGVECRWKGELVHENARWQMLTHDPVGESCNRCCLIGLERGDGFLRLRHALVVGIKRDEISERRNRLHGGVLVVFGRRRLPRIRNAFTEQRVGGNGRLVVVTVGGGGVGLHRVGDNFSAFRARRRCAIARAGRRRCKGRC